MPAFQLGPWDPVASGGGPALPIDGRTPPGGQFNALSMKFERSDLSAAEQFALKKLTAALKAEVRERSQR
jgi:hypothetical protein